MRSRLTIQTLDLHAGGEPLRLVTAGYPPAPHAPILERRRWAREEADHVRKVICFEPRGHREMYGAVVLPAYRDDAAHDLEVRPDGVTLAGEAALRGSLRVDVGFGGAYYGIVDASDLGLRVVPQQTEVLTRAGAAITEVLRRDHSPTHPFEADLGF